MSALWVLCCPVLLRTWFQNGACPDDGFELVYARLHVRRDYSRFICCFKMKLHFMVWRHIEVLCCASLVAL